MLRNSVFAILVLLGGVAWSEAQFYPRPAMQRRPVFLRGTWFNDGDRRQPCFIREGPGGSLLLTNEKGEDARGHQVRGGRIVADDWDGLVGDVRGNIISWQNGTYWSR